MTLEEEAEIEKRSLQESPVFQQEGDHQAADPPIAVEIGMNSFELCVQETRPHEVRQPVGGVDVFFESAKKLREFLGGRWNINRVPRPASANPVLAAAYFSGLLASAAHTTHQSLVCFVQEPQGKRQTTLRRELAARVGEGVEVVCHLFDIGVGLGLFLGFESEKVDERCLRALDLRRDHRFLAHEGIDEPVERRHHLARQIESDKRLLSLPKATFELGVDDERRPHGRQIEGNEGIDFFAACGHAFVSACCALRHDLVAQPGDDVLPTARRRERSRSLPAELRTNSLLGRALSQEIVPSVCR